MRVEQDADLVLMNLKLKILGQPNDDVLLTTDRLFKHYEGNEDRVILKDRLLFRNYYGETGSVKYYQILISKKLVSEVLRSLQGEFGKHPGITQTKIAYKEKYYYPNKAQLIRKWVMSCKQCLRALRFNHILSRYPLQNPNKCITESIKQALKVETREWRSFKHKYVGIGVLNYSRSLHASIGCEPRREFHGRIPHNVPDLKLGIQRPSLTIRPRFAWTNRNLFPRCPQKCHASLYQIQSVLWLKSQRLKTQTIRLRLHLTVKRGPSTKQNSFHSFSLNWTLHYSKGVTQRLLFGTQNWHESDASTSSKEATPIHSPPTHTGYTNHTTWMEITPVIIIKHGSMGVWIWEANLW